MKDAQQLQAGVDRMFPSQSVTRQFPMTSSAANDGGWVIVPAHYLASLQEDRALWDAVEMMSGFNAERAGELWEVTFFHIDRWVDVSAATPREAVAKARDAIEDND